MKICRAFINYVAALYAPTRRCDKLERRIISIRHLTAPRITAYRLRKKNCHEKTWQDSGVTKNGNSSTLSWSQREKGDSEMPVVGYLLPARIPSGPRPPFESVAV